MVEDLSIQAVPSVPRWVEDLDQGWAEHQRAVKAFNEANARAHGYFNQWLADTSSKSAEKISPTEAYSYLIDQICLKCQTDFVTGGVVLKIDIGEWKNKFNEGPIEDFSPSKLYSLLADKYLGAAGSAAAAEQSAAAIKNCFSKRLGLKTFKDSVKFILRGFAEDRIWSNNPGSVYYSYNSREDLRKALIGIKTVFTVIGFDFDPEKKYDRLVTIATGFTSDKEFWGWGTAEKVSEHMTLTPRKNGIEVKLSHEAFAIIKQNSNGAFNEEEAE